MTSSSQDLGKQPVSAPERAECTTLEAVMAAAARGDHGTAQDAIDFILDSPEPWAAGEFLPRWREGNLDDWPEFYAFLAKRWDEWAADGPKGQDGPVGGPGTTPDLPTPTQQGSDQ